MRTAELDLARQAVSDLEERAAILLAREKALDADARERARAYLLEARKTVEAALAQARAAVDEATAKEARRLVEDAIEKTGGEAVRRLGGSTELAVGDRVRTGQGKVGTVAEIRDDGRVVVEVGSIRLVIASDLLERVDPQTAQPPNRPTAS
jgi:dsDNA-specific endonuclease/ATPase MutS2